MSIASIVIVEDKSAITNIFFEREKENNVILAEIKETYLIKKTYIEIEEYLNRQRRYFDVPLYLKGTIFYTDVWNELLKIPYGETRTYSQIAKLIAHPKAARAVGMACNKNPIPIIVPCHRVIGTNGSLTGYAGGVELKRVFLNLESEY